MNSLDDTLGEDIAATVTHFLNLPTAHRSSISTTHTDQKPTTITIPTDIIETETNYIFYLDVPGLSKSEIQVTVDDERTLVVKSNGKRKREVGAEEEGCEFLRLERMKKSNLLRKFRLPEDADLGVIEAKCDNGVLVISVGKNPPPPKGKSVQVKIA